jgi:hypothetical protein
MTLRASSAGGSVATATVRVTNTGGRAGADVPQLYVDDPTATGEPPRQLKGYARVNLAPKASATVSLPLDARALSWWNASTHAWTVSAGCYTVSVGANERDIVGSEMLAVNGARCPGATASITAGGGTPAPYACYRPSGGLAGTSLGPARLGMTRAAVRRRFAARDRRGRRYIDLYCVGHNSLRVGYATPALLRALPRAQRGRLSGRAVLLLTSSRHFALRGVRPHTRLTRALERRLRVGRPYHVGRNFWYLIAAGPARGVLKVQHGEIGEVGIATRSLTSPRKRAARFLRSFS